jgi:hypothetical protein
MDTVDELMKLCEGDEELSDLAFRGLQMTLNKVKAHHVKKSLTGKETPSIIDNFVRPTYITSKRRAGIVDIYHGGKRGKRMEPPRHDPMEGDNSECNAAGEVIVELIMI